MKDMHLLIIPEHEVPEIAIGTNPDSILSTTEYLSGFESFHRRDQG